MSVQSLPPSAPWDRFATVFRASHRRVARDPCAETARSRLQTGDPAEMRRQADASGGVAPQSERRSARGDQRRLAAAGSAGGPRKIVRVIGSAVDQVIAFKSERRSERLVRASGIAPAARRRATRVASLCRSGALRRPMVPAVQTVPATSMESLIENGISSSGRVTRLLHAAVGHSSALARGSRSTSIAASAPDLLSHAPYVASSNSAEEMEPSRMRRPCAVPESRQYAGHGSRITRRSSVDMW